MIQLLTTAGQVFVMISTKPDSRMRDIAAHLNVTERTVMHSLSQLMDEGLISVRRLGRRNIYEVHENGHIRVGNLRLSLAEFLVIVRNADETNVTYVHRGNDQL